MLTVTVLDTANTDARLNKPAPANSQYCPGKII